jgi:DNA-binding response OmpR family regulator
MRLLLVEDDEELAQLLAQRLQAAGYETDFLTTAAEALAAVTTTRYAAMVLDLGLPEPPGRDQAPQGDRARNHPTVSRESNE